jgi:molecular chaperone Hsp33
MITRIMTTDGSARLFVIESTELVQRAQQIHKTSKTMTAVLGRALTGCSLMGTLLKDADHSLTLQFKGGGPAGTVCCVSDYAGNVRGYADNPEVELPPNSIGKLDVGGAVGKDGVMQVIKDLGMSVQPYAGLCPLHSGEIADDITEYFARSEQTPTVCALGVRCDAEKKCIAAGGFLLQLMPGADDATVDRLEENIGKINSVSAIVGRADSMRVLADLVLNGIEYEVFDQFPIEYRCSCTRQRYANALRTLGREELTDMIAAGEDIECVCRFCKERYVFPVEQLKEWLC